MIDLADELSALVDSRDEICVVFDDRLQVLAANDSAREAWPAFVAGGNIARAVFLDPEFDMMIELGQGPVVQVVELLRTGLEKAEDDTAGSRLVGELAAQSAAFARLWATPVPFENRGTIRLPSGESDWMSYEYVITTWHRDTGIRLMTWRVA